MEKYNKILESFIEHFGIFALGGMVGAIIHRIRNTMSIRQFLLTVITSVFVGILTGIATRNYLHLNEEVTFGIVSLAGVFSKDLLDFIEDILNQLKYSTKYISLFIKKLIENKTNTDLDN